VSKAPKSSGGSGGSDSGSDPGPGLLHRLRGSRIGGLGTHAEEGIDEHFIKRLERLSRVRRFVAGWVGLLTLLIIGLVVQLLALSGYYQSVRPVPGGIYNEGVQGRFTNANPLFATGDANATVSRLLFAGLMSYDEQGRLHGDLASGYEVSEHGTVYTVHLRPHLTWQDGRPLTSRDVTFTYKLIQNPDVQSPLQSSWQGIDITAPDSRTVVFTLPDALASFPYNLTTGIVPEHLLSKIPPVDMRSADFNTVNPVGAGPFAWQAVEVNNSSDPDHVSEQIALTPFDGYHAGKPKLQKFVVQAFASQDQLIKAFKSQQLTAVEGLDRVPPALKNDKSVVQHSLRLRAATMVFFKTSSGVLSESQVRQALVRATDVNKIIRHLGYTTREVKEPLLMGQLGYDPTFAQLPFDPKAAATLLNADGWRPGDGGYLYKDGNPLAFTLTAADTPENRMVTGMLKQQWRAVGVKLGVRLQSADDFNGTLSDHDYDAVLDGISIGVDPDVFVYWDSSQTDVRSNRLNLSEYKNPAADTALEAGRTRLDPELRIIKYRPFLQAWQQDAPAVGLYQPRLLYLTNGTVAGLNDAPITKPTDRLANVQNWEIRQAKVTN
jgi:peptide/nickel transport system substrate-binding protein